MGWPCSRDIEQHEGGSDLDRGDLSDFLNHCFDLGRPVTCPHSASAEGKWRLSETRQAQVGHDIGILILLEKVLANVSGSFFGLSEKHHKPLEKNMMRSWWNW